MYTYKGFCWIYVGYMLEFVAEVAGTLHAPLLPQSNPINTDSK